jgi:hypothetical protein
MIASSRPAVAFTLTIKNTGETDANVSFMFNMPFRLEADQERRGAALGGATALVKFVCFFSPQINARVQTAFAIKCNVYNPPVNGDAHPTYICSRTFRTGHP